MRKASVCHNSEATSCLCTHGPSCVIYAIESVRKLAFHCATGVLACLTFFFGASNQADSEQAQKHTACKGHVRKCHKQSLCYNPTRPLLSRAAYSQFDSHP